VPESSRINKEEIFGPVLVVHPFTDEADVIRRANDTECTSQAPFFPLFPRSNTAAFVLTMLLARRWEILDGLFANVFTKDIDRAVRVARALEAGSVCINSAMTMLPDMVTSSNNSACAQTS
jgi:aldehyde dehydrogenase (NAD+)